ncbi:MAG: L,D-transpeptidase [Hyphomicrobiaceae bacterium]|nr:L,D-transpeptidase [Hyphomicrobiaceae bacterium]
MPEPSLAQRWSENGPVWRQRRQTAAGKAGSRALQSAARPTEQRSARSSCAGVATARHQACRSRLIVYFDQKEDPGSIIIDTQERKLYFVLPGKKAYQYPISVGRDGFTWTGTERISRIAEWPSWTPPPEMHKRVPGLPLTVTGGIKNPQGARALYLGNTVYRIHGTNNDRSVGRANSSGCFRLKNEHVVHLASIAKVGTKVRVLQSYAGNVSESMPLTSLFGFFGGDEPEADKKASKSQRKRSAKSKPAPNKSASAPASAPAPTKKAAVE